MDTLDKIKDEATGCTITLEVDCDLEQPFVGESAVIMAVLHRQYVNPSKTLTTVDEIADFMAAQEAAGEASEYVCYPLFMYDHSGTVYRASNGPNPFSCQWDSGRVGVIALKRGALSDLSLESANRQCETYTAWANGQGVAYVITDADGDRIDSCGGYYSEADALAAARENLPEPVPTLL